MLDISLCVRLSIEGHALDVAVLGAIVLCNESECTALNCNLCLVKERRTEPIAARSRLYLVESKR